MGSQAGSGLTRIKSILVCKKKCKVYTNQEKPEDGKCKCGLKLRRIIPLQPDKAHCFKCHACQLITPTEPANKKGIRWYCPSCEELEVYAYACSTEYLKALMDKQASEEERYHEALKGLVGSDNPFDFAAVVRRMLSAQDAVNLAAFEALKLSEALGKRRVLSDDGQTFVDQAAPDLGRYNRRAQMVMDMLLVKLLMEAAGLVEYVPWAMTQMLNARLNPGLKAGGGSISSRPNHDMDLRRER